MLKLRSPRVRTATATVRVTAERQAPTTPNRRHRPRTPLTYVPVTMPAAAPLPRSEGDRDDLQIRNLLDDPALRRAMGLDPAEPTVRPATVAKRPEPRFDRRRLLDAAA